MRVPKYAAAGILCGLMGFAPVAIGQGRRGGFVPGQQRPPGDPAVIARGKTLWGIHCTGCHGADLRGGDLGGPNLLRSQIALTDLEGERIVPVIQGGLPSMPAIAMPPEDAKAIATYVRSVIVTIGRQGMPPESMAPPSILVGDAAAGKAYFDSKCASCHSATGDLQGLATKYSDPRLLQNTWVSGGGRGGRGGGGGVGPMGPRTVTAVVTMSGGEKVEGRLVRIDDFLVTLALEDGVTRTIRRKGDVPKVEVHDPMKPHRDLLAVYTDKDMHDLTAYLVTLK
jgi:cytochrome c oxidase cbb3-type subunit 3